MLIRDLMTKGIEAVTPEDSAALAAEIMSRRNCGFVPVVHDKIEWKLEGVLTDRDLALFLGRADRWASEVQVKEFLTRNPKAILEDDEIHEAKARMEEFHIHRLPVVDRGGKLMGIVSLKDLAQEAWKERAYDFPTLAEKDIAEIVESISLAR